MCKKFKFKKKFTGFSVTFGNVIVEVGDELNVNNNGYVCDGCLQLFNVNSEQAKEYGKIVERLY